MSGIGHELTGGLIVNEYYGAASANAVIDAGAGTVTIDGRTRIAASNEAFGVGLFEATQIRAGAIVITGTADASAAGATSTAVQFLGAQLTAGDITVGGTAKLANPNDPGVSFGISAERSMLSASRSLTLNGTAGNFGVLLDKGTVISLTPASATAGGLLAITGEGLECSAAAQPGGRRAWWRHHGNDRAHHWQRRFVGGAAARAVLPRCSPVTAC